MQSHTLSLFSDVALDTPPLSPSRSPSLTSAARSSVASSSSSISLGDFASRMSKARFEHPVYQHSTESVDSHVAPRKFAHDNIIYSGARERDIQEELESDMEHGDLHHRGRSGYDGLFAYHQTIPETRPSMPRQGSFSKRHSSFDTPREIPFPCGYLSSSASPLSGQAVPSRDLQQERSSSAPVVPQDMMDQSASQPGTNTGSYSDCPSSQDSDSPSPPRTSIGRISSSSLPLPTSLHYSSLPPLVPPGSPPRYEKPRPAPMVPKFAVNSLDTGDSPVASPPRTSSLNPRVANKGVSSRSPPRSQGQSPSPPILVDENDANEPSAAQSSHIQPGYDARNHNSLPPPQKNSSLAFTSSSSSRPTSLPHVGGPSIPPPQPPTILTPPPPLSADEEGARKRAPYEPFLPRDQLPADHTYIAVETVPSEYRLIVRLPGFQRDSMYVVSFI